MINTKKILFLIVLLFSFPIVISYKNDKKIIVIDAGHDCIFDKGASVGTVYEGVINLAIAKKLENLFVKNDFKVVMTREDENHLCKNEFVKKEDMQKRCQIINSSNCTFFLSIHLNIFPASKYRGAEVYYSGNNKSNELLAGAILNQIKTELNNTSRSIKQTDSLYLLNNVTNPGCLIECGFMSNEEELMLLQDEEYQKKISAAIFNGTMIYLNVV